MQPDQCRKSLFLVRIDNGGACLGLSSIKIAHTPACSKTYIIVESLAWKWDADRIAIRCLRHSRQSVPKALPNTCGGLSNGGALVCIANSCCYQPPPYWRCCAIHSKASFMSCSLLAAHALTTRISPQQVRRPAHFQRKLGCFPYVRITITRAALGLNLRRCLGPKIYLQYLHRYYRLCCSRLRHQPSAHWRLDRRYLMWDEAAWNDGLKVSENTYST